MRIYYLLLYIYHLISRYIINYSLMQRIQQHMKTFQKAVQKYKKTQIQLVKKLIYNHDSILCRFNYVADSIPLKIGNHLVFEAKINTWQYSEGEIVRRKFTPISPCSNTEYLDFLFKIYRSNTNQTFPHGGKMTQKLEDLKIGDIVDVQGPIGKFNYEKGLVTIEGRNPFKINKIVMVAGGSGISPMYNIITQIIKDKDDNTELVLLFANKTQRDILLRNQLQELQPRLKLYLMKDQMTPGWQGFTGYVDKNILQKITNLNQQQTMYCSCGPRAMNEAVKNIITQSGGKYFKF